MTNIRHSVLKWFNQNRYGDIALVWHHGSAYLLAKKNRLDMKLMGGVDWEHELRDRAVGEIKRHGIDVFIDAGANLGLYTIDLNRRCDLKETIAFEPLPNNFYQLCGNVFANDLSDRVIVERSALSDTDGTATIWIDSAYTIHSTLDKDARDNPKFDKSITVPLMRFDSRYSFENRRIFVKMDVEGHEVSALLGMEQLLRRNKVSLHIEAGVSTFAPVTAFMTGLGYRLEGTRRIDHYFSNF